ncbi:ABC zinc transporter, metal-binding lipoprotein [Streptococcus pneumoniae 845]|nr:ABC zinc transporter, metal-binding lipoprotein [Streptococcus pneumoniae 845]
MKKISLLLASLCALFLVACSNQKQADGKLNIVTTFYPVYEFTKQVAGDTANVELLIGAGTEPHEYEPSAKAVAKIQDADTFVYENENMETWVPKLLDTLDKKKVKTIKRQAICCSCQVARKKRETMTMEKKVITMSLTPMFGYHQFVPLN